MEPIPAHPRRRRPPPTSASLLGSFLAKSGFRVSTAESAPGRAPRAQGRRRRPRRPRHHDAGRGRAVALPRASARRRACRSSCSPPRPRRRTASSASRSAPTTTSPSRSARASCSPGSRPCCGAPSALPPRVAHAPERAARLRPLDAGHRASRAGRRGRRRDCRCRTGEFRLLSAFVDASAHGALPRPAARPDPRPRRRAVRPQRSTTRSAGCARRSSATRSARRSSRPLGRRLHAGRRSHRGPAHVGRKQFRRPADWQILLCARWWRRRRLSFPSFSRDDRRRSRHGPNRAAAGFRPPPRSPRVPEDRQSDDRAALAEAAVHPASGSG